MDLGQVRPKKGGKFCFFMVTAIGLTATVYPLIKDALMTLLKFNPKPKKFLTLDDESKIEVETMLVTITNTPLIGLKNLVAPDASLEDGLLDMSVYPGFSKADVLAYFAGTANESSAADEKVERYHARKIMVETSPKLDIAAEGILLAKGKAWIKSLPGALREIAPEPGTGTEEPVEKAATKLPEPVSPISQ